jgi:hypothetical protein
MATGAVLYRAEQNQQQVEVEIPLSRKERYTSRRKSSIATKAEPITWKDALAGTCQCHIPDKLMQRLYDTALYTLILHSPDEVYPGPFTYKRFWFRDAAFIVHAMLLAGWFDRVERVLSFYPSRQTHSGYFRSQQGEWDSNGEALWILQRFCQVTGRKLNDDMLKAVERGGQWIIQKRLSPNLDKLHAGLMPAGFSAEHLGPNDFYYWDDFWSITGLQAADDVLQQHGRSDKSPHLAAEAKSLAQCVEKSLADSAFRRSRNGIPASCYRRMDAGAIGSLAAGYPLQLWDPDDQRLLETACFLRDNCFVHGGFFQDMIHSGINPYLTLHVAQVMLRAGDPGYFDMMKAVANSASPTGQWPEAIHPRTGGGCMGDGQHVWAAAEWILMLRNCFIREEGTKLMLASGIPQHWLETGETMSFGPAPTSFGTVHLEVKGSDELMQVRWQGEWRNKPTAVIVKPAGTKGVEVPVDQGHCEIPLSYRNGKDNRQ